MGPLSGVVVLDLGQYLAGPYGAMILGDLGAEVIKVNRCAATACGWQAWPSSAVNVASRTSQ